MQQVSNYAYYPILVTEKYSKSRDELYEILKENNVFTRKYFYPLTLEQRCYKGMYADKNLEVARKMSKQILVLPMYEELQENVQQQIMQIIEEKGKK